jgi:hypothetical protein
MSSSILYYRDSKGNIIPVEFDPTGDSTELGDKIKATVASHEESNITPTDYVFSTLPNSSASASLQYAPAERSGVAPEQRDSTQIPSLKDVTEIKKQESKRLLVKTWLSSDVGDLESTAGHGVQRCSTFDEETCPVLDTESGRIDLATAAGGARFTIPADEEDQRSEPEALGTPLLTPDATHPATSDGDVQKITDVKPFHSAYEMAHGSDEHSVDQSPERQVPKRMDSTSMANVMTYQRKAAQWDAESITATVGSKKTIESIYDGTSIKDLSLSEHKGRERGATFTDKVRNLIPRRSSSKLNNKKKDPSPTDSPAEEKLTDSNHKRGLSTTSLMPPENDSASTYMYNTTADANGYLTTNGRRSSEIPDASGATSPLTRLKRSFSKGEKRKSFTESGSTPHIVGLMRREGGPPVSTALVSPLHEHGGFEDSAVEPSADDEKEDDDDDDEDEGDSDSNAGVKAKGGHADLSIETVAITPDFNGFKEHALHLNPDMASFLADRVAQEQIRRFKELKGYKVRHVQDVHRQQCGSGIHCPALGGEPTYLPARSNNKGEKTQIFLIKGHPEIDEPGVTSTNFQHGIPEPPVRQLPATFECSLCFKERKAMNKPSDWTKHVHEDLQPFTCTFRMCTTEKKSFKRKADWVRHENECHRHLDEWRCNFADCQHVCYRSDNFSQHLIREHKVADFKNKTRGSISSKIRAQPISQYGQEEELIAKLHRTCRAASTAKPDSEPCVFCGAVSPSWKKHQVHLSKHMESIALPVLVLIAREEVSPDTTISPIRREQVAPMTGPNTISDVMSTTDAHTLTPYSTNGSSLHRGSSASQSPMGFRPVSQTDAQLPPYLLGTNSFNSALAASQAMMGGPGFAPQHTSGPEDDGSYEQLGYGPTQTGYLDLDPFHQTHESLQREATPLYGGHQQLQSFTHVNPNTPGTYPPPNLQRSPAQNQLHPLMAFSTPDQMPGHEYANSPHSGTSYHRSTTPSPNRPRAFLANPQLEIPRSGPMVGEIPTYPTGNYSNAYDYTDQPAPYASPLEAAQYSNDFHPSIEAQEYMAATTALKYDATTATSLPVDNTIYDAQQYGVYAPHTLAPHSRPYQYQ